MDHDKKLQALKRRALKELGRDTKTLSVEDAHIKLYELEQKIKDSETKKEKITGRQIVSKMLEMYDFPKKRRKLLRTLASSELVRNSSRIEMRCVEKSKLEKKCDSENIKALKRDTNNQLRRYLGDQVVFIKSCIDLRKIGRYRLIITSLFLEILGIKNSP